MRRNSSVWSLRRARPQQLAASHEQIGERARDEQAMRVLVQSPVADLGEAEHPLDNEKRVLDFCSDLRLGPVLRPLGLINHAAMPVAAIGEILGIRRVLDDHLSLTAISLIAPHPGLVPAQEIRQKM